MALAGIAAPRGSPTGMQGGVSIADAGLIPHELAERFRVALESGPGKTPRGSHRRGCVPHEDLVEGRSIGAAMKGDRVEILVDAGTGGVERFEIGATRAGRRIEVTTGRGVVEVAEVTRTGRPVRSGRFMASRVVALVEHPAQEGEGGVDETTGRLLGSQEPAQNAGGD